MLRRPDASIGVVRVQVLGSTGKKVANSSAVDDDDSAVQVAHGVWVTLSGLPEPALLIAGDEFSVIALNSAAQSLFDGASAIRATQVLSQSMPRQLLERICRSAARKGGHVNDMPVQLALGESGTHDISMTILPMAVRSGPPMAVMYLKVMPQPIGRTPAALISQEFLSWLPIPAWLFDRNRRLNYQNPRCVDLQADSSCGQPEAVLVNALNGIPGSSNQCAAALQSTMEQAIEQKTLVSQTIVTDGEAWRIVHGPVVGLDGESYVMGLALPRVKDLSGDSLFDDMAPAGSTEPQRRRSLQVRTRERERYKLAREIHDSLGQELTVLRLAASRLVETLQQEIPQHLTGAHLEQFTNLSAQLSQAITSSRRIAFGLRLDLVDSQGLMVAIESLVNAMRLRLGIAGQLEVGYGWTNPTGKLAQNMYRSVQELLNNLAKHSQANNFIVRLAQWGPDYEIEVVDDGVGIPDSRLSTSIGLRTMKERAELFHGHMLVLTRPEVDGTSVKLTFYGDPPRDAGDTNFG